MRQTGCLPAAFVAAGFAAVCMVSPMLAIASAIAAAAWGVMLAGRKQTG